MVQVKMFFDYAHLTDNHGYENLEQKLNKFLVEIQNDVTFVKIIDIKYSCVFNGSLNNNQGVSGIVQKSALLIYEISA